MNNSQSLTKNLPKKPGVYLFKDKSGRVLYVGKAMNLKNRVLSHFKNPLPNKTGMPQKIAKIDHLVCASEIQALLLELNLIKRHRPKYNVAFKDDKRYPLIKIDYSDDFPKIQTARKIKDDGGSYFGPFPHAKVARHVLILLNRLFRYRQCDLKIFEEKVRQKKYHLCLRHQIGRCLAPCVGKISKKDYGNLIKKCRLFLLGKQKKILRDLEREMKKAASDKKYEEAAKLRDQWLNLKKFIEEYPKNFLSHLGQRKESSELKIASFESHDQCLPQRHRSAAALELKKILETKSDLRRIEGFDISNISGKSACGSMAVFQDGVPDKSKYRRFKISFDKIDDLTMMKEMLMRRFRHASFNKADASILRNVSNKAGASSLKNSSFQRWPLPDLIVLDGGKGQLGIAVLVLRHYHLDIPLLALAKKKEEIYLPKKSSPIFLPQRSPALHLLQNLRDEAHRFALSYHKKLRAKTLLT